MNGDILYKMGNSDEQSEKNILSSTVHYLLSNEQCFICLETDLSTTVQLEETRENNSKTTKKNSAIQSE